MKIGDKDNFLIIKHIKSDLAKINKNNISSNLEELDKNKGNISSNLEKIDKNKGNISSNLSKINNIENNISKTYIKNIYNILFYDKKLKLIFVIYLMKNHFKLMLM